MFKLFGGRPLNADDAGDPELLTNVHMLPRMI